MSLITVSVFVLIAIVLIVLLTSVLKLNAFVSLFAVSLLLALTALPGRDVISVMKDGFGSTMSSIGFLIIFGAMIAVMLEKSGGAVSIANYMLSKTGNNKAAAALGITGFIAGMPIFCDSGFIILSGLAKSFSAKSKIALPFVAIVLATSLYSVHCLLPTHPGTLAAASFVVPMLPALGLQTETGKLLTMISMGAGSMMISHANDAYFWVITRFSGINVNTTLKVYSTATVVMGVTVFLCVLLTSYFVL